MYHEIQEYESTYKYPLILQNHNSKLTDYIILLSSSSETSIIQEEDEKQNMLNVSWSLAQYQTEFGNTFCVKNINSSIDYSLKHWIKGIKNTHLFEHSYSISYNPIDPKNPYISITIPYLRNRAGLMKNLKAIVETPFGFKLFEGTMINGNLTTEVDQHLINHPGWKTRLIIRIVANKNKIQLRGSLKNGKLNGLVQIYGILPRNHEGRCSDLVEAGLSFVGHFENGTPVGPCWRKLIGGSWLYGTLDEKHEFTGTKIAYLYQDLKLVMIGEFKNGLMVSESFLRGNFYSNVSLLRNNFGFSHYIHFRSMVKKLR